MIKKLSWETKKVKVCDLIPLNFNPRKITEDKRQKLIESLEKFNLAEIPAVNTDLTIIGGNQRVFALHLMGRGEEEIDVRYPNRKLSEKELKEYAIISNTHAGEWDMLKLEEFFDDVDFEELGFDMKFDLLDEEEQNTVIEEEPEAKEDDYEIQKEIQTDIVLGDLFEIGKHRLICGDSTRTDTFEKLMQGELADMVLTDPPYNVSYEGGTKEKLTIKNDSMKNDDFYNFLYDFYTALSTVVKKGGVVYVWHASSEIINFAKAFVDAGFLLKQQLIWLKNQLVMGRQDYQWKHEPCLEGINSENWETVKEHEPCLYGWKQGAGHFWKGGRKQTTILEFDKPRRNGEHPTMKPIPLFGIQIKNSTKPGEIVIDGFGGSGTTMVACEQLKRIARVVEFDPKYCQVIIDRMRKLDPSLVIKRNGEVWN
jgi:DNA modification methylase